MAYTAIADSDIDPESPITTTLLTRMRDNPIGIANADSGAPPVVNAALTGYPFSAVDDITGTWALIESWTPSAVNSKDFTWDEAVYSDIKVVIDNVIPATDGAELRLRFGHDNGATILTSTSQTSSRDFNDTSFYADTNQSYAALTYRQTTIEGVGSAAGESFSSTINLYCLSAGRLSYLEQSAAFETSGGLQRQTILRADLNDTTGIDTIRLYWSSGNFETTGKIYVYGLKKA